MNAIEQAKHDGAVNALRRRIHAFQDDLSITNWYGIEEKSRFIRLGEAIQNAEVILQQMRETLEALQEMEPDNQ